VTASAKWGISLLPNLAMSIGCKTLAQFESTGMLSLQLRAYDCCAIIQIKLNFHIFTPYFYAVYSSNNALMFTNMQSFSVALYWLSSESYGGHLWPMWSQFRLLSHSSKSQSINEMQQPQLLAAVNK